MSTERLAVPRGMPLVVEASSWAWCFERRLRNGCFLRGARNLKDVLVALLRRSSLWGNFRHVCGKGHFPLSTCSWLKG